MGRSVEEQGLGEAAHTAPRTPKQGGRSQSKSPVRDSKSDTESDSNLEVVRSADDSKRTRVRSGASNAKGTPANLPKTSLTDADTDSPSGEMGGVSVSELGKVHLDEQTRAEAARKKGDAKRERKAQVSALQRQVREDALSGRFSADGTVSDKATAASIANLTAGSSKGKSK